MSAAGAVTEQLQLVPTGPKLTERQQFALELVEAAGRNGIHADELGAILHEERGKHPRDSRCQWDGANGKSILDALKKKGLVRYVRSRNGLPGFWRAESASAAPPARGMLQDTEPIPF